MKQCSKCKIQKALEEFYLKGIRRNKQRYRSDCKDCFRVFHKKYGIGRFKKYVMNNPDKYKAHIKLRSAVSRGSILKPSNCQICSILCSKPSLQAHHNNYDRPLDVIWVCPRCHNDIHRKILNKSKGIQTPFDN